jgi:DNA-damage-inducible protein J
LTPTPRSELEAGKGQKFASVDDLMADLHADD